MEEFFIADARQLIFFRGYEEAGKVDAYVLSYATIRRFIELYQKRCLVEIWEAKDFRGIGKSKCGYRMGYIRGLEFDAYSQKAILFAFYSGHGEKIGDIIITQDQIKQLEKGFN